MTKTLTTGDNMTTTRTFSRAASFRAICCDLCSHPQPCTRAGQVLARGTEADPVPTCPSYKPAARRDDAQPTLLDFAADQNHQTTLF